MFENAHVVSNVWVMNKDWFSANWVWTDHCDEQLDREGLVITT